MVQPDGHARDTLAEFLPPKVPLPAGSCGDMPYTGPLDEVGSIGVEPDGAISVCHELAIGNAVQEDVLEILQHYDPYQIPEAHALLEGGVAALVDLARARGIALDPDGYYSICDLRRSPLGATMASHRTPRSSRKERALCMTCRRPPSVAPD